MSGSAPASWSRPAEDQLYQPEMAEIVATRSLTDSDRLFEIQLPGGKELGQTAGQFVQVSVFGFGEAPISVCSSPVRTDSFELCVRKVGGLTAALHSLREGDKVGIRGPYGNGFPLDCMEKMDCLVVAGGIGLAPLRSVIQTILARRDVYGRMIVLYGTRSPNDILFADEIAEWQEDPASQILVTVDHPTEGWEGNVGVVTTLFPKVEIDPANTVVVALVGPPVMYRSVLSDLTEIGVPDQQIFFSLERRMECGVGKCGHCQIDDRCVCVDGPVFSATDLKHMHESI